MPSERELIAALGVSRSSVREALQGLVAMNVLESRPGEGTFVRPTTGSPLWNLDGKQISLALEKKMRLDLLQTRAIVDEAIALLAAERASDLDLDRVGESLAKYEAAMRSGDEASLASAHNQVHLAIAQASGNYFLGRMLEMLLGTLPSSLRNPEFQFASERERDMMLVREAECHHRLHAAVLSRDAERVRAAVREHVEFAHSVIEGAFSQLVQTDPSPGSSAPPAG